MDNLEAYSYLFSDSLMTSLLFATNNDLVFDAMLIFKRHNLALIIILSSLGAVVGAMINWVIGYLFRFIEKTEAMSHRKGALAEGSKLFKDTPLKFIVLLSFIPLWGGLITAATGVFRLNFWHTLWMVTLSKTLFYMYFGLAYNEYLFG